MEKRHMKELHALEKEHDEADAKLIEDHSNGSTAAAVRPAPVDAVDGVDRATLQRRKRGREQQALALVQQRVAEITTQQRIDDVREHWDKRRREDEVIEERRRRERREAEDREDRERRARREDEDRDVKRVLQDAELQRCYSFLLGESY